MNAKNKALGKNFGSLLPDDFDKSILIDKKDRVEKISLLQISPDPNQPRKHFDTVALAELAASIKTYGILQPLVVCPDKNDYIIIAGERRFKAAKIAGLKSVPVLIRSSQELERLEIGLVENVQRVDLSPIEQAVSIAKLHEQFNLSYEQIAKKLGKAHSTIINMVRLLKLPEQARIALEQGKISEGHARTVLSLNASSDQQKQLLKSIIKNGWSVRQAEQYVNQQKLKASPKNPAPLADDTLSSLAKDLSKKLGAKVSIQPKSSGGKITIAYKNQTDLDAIAKKLKA